MPDSQDAHRQAVALFRYGLIADLVRLPPGSDGITDRLRTKAEQDYAIPGSRRTRVAPPRRSATGSSATATAASTRCCPGPAAIAVSPVASPMAWPRR